jgi:hypothetical protein
MYQTCSMTRLLLHSLALIIAACPALVPAIALDTSVGVNSISTISRRKLNQDDASRVVMFYPAPSDFGLTPSQAISEIGSWFKNPLFSYKCDNGDTLSPENPDLCVDRVEVTMRSSFAGNTTVVFDADQLDSFMVTSPDGINVYGLPLNKYASPNALYENVQYRTVFRDGDVADFEVNAPTIYNYFNASAASLREYYGVDAELQGTEETVQGSTMAFGGMDSAVNTTAVEEYLVLQGLVPNIPLQLSDWAVENDVSVCKANSINAGWCGETMLDVQAQQAFAPQAVTYFAPTELILGTFVEKLSTFLGSEGYSAVEIERFIQQVIEKFDSGAVDILEPLPASAQSYISELLTEYFLEFVNNVTTSEERPQVVSLSWSSSYPLRDESILEDALKNLALSGLSILVASGDSGASGDHSPPVSATDRCRPEDNPLESNKVNNWPIFSPWVTAVGGTQILATREYPEGTEVVASSLTDGGITSGGGFAGSNLPSSLYSMPVWQKKFAERYLSENNASTFDGFPTKDTPGFNPMGRAYPDISMYAAKFPILNIDGNVEVTAGTSLSAPIAAAVFTLANQRLLADGYETIGYANPMIYWMGENCTDAFKDITVGDIRGGDDGTECLWGFPAAPGWDPATGFGSIQFDPFVACAKRYQDEVRSKGLELLPDGTLNTAAGSSGSKGKDGNGPAPGPSVAPMPGSSAADLRWMSSMVASWIAMLALN